MPSRPPAGADAGRSGERTGRRSFWASVSKVPWSRLSWLSASPDRASDRRGTECGGRGRAAATSASPRSPCRLGSSAAAPLWDVPPAASASTAAQLRGEQARLQSSGSSATVFIAWNSIQARAGWPTVTAANRVLRRRTRSDGRRAVPSVASRARISQQSKSAAGHADNTHLRSFTSFPCGQSALSRSRQRSRRAPDGESHDDLRGPESPPRYIVAPIDGKPRACVVRHGLERRRVGVVRRVAAGAIRGGEDPAEVLAAARNRSSRATRGRARRAGRGWSGVVGGEVDGRGQRVGLARAGRGNDRLGDLGRFQQVGAGRRRRECAPARGYEGDGPSHVSRHRSVGRSKASCNGNPGTEGGAGAGRGRGYTPRMKRTLLVAALFFAAAVAPAADKPRARDLGIPFEGTPGHSTRSPTLPASRSGRARSSAVRARSGWARGPCGRA